MWLHISKSRILMVFLLGIISNRGIAQQLTNLQKNGLTKGPADRFLGDVWVQYFVNDSANDFLASKVIFEPNARSNWHQHKGIQIIFGIGGEGFYKEKGKEIKILKKGDVVVIEPGTIHAHGSMLTKTFIQAVMMNNIHQQDATIWLDRVKEDELEIIHTKK